MVNVRTEIPSKVSDVGSGCDVTEESEGLDRLSQKCFHHRTQSDGKASIAVDKREARDASRQSRFRRRLRLKVLMEKPSVINPYWDPVQCRSGGQDDRLSAANRRLREISS